MTKNTRSLDRVDAIVEKARKDDRLGLDSNQKEILEGLIRQVAIAIVFDSGIKSAKKDLEGFYQQVLDDNHKIQDDKGRFLSPAQAAEADLASLREANKTLRDEPEKGKKKHHPKEKGNGHKDGISR